MPYSLSPFCGSEDGFTQKWAIPLSISFWGGRLIRKPQIMPPETSDFQSIAFHGPPISLKWRKCSGEPRFPPKLVGASPPLFPHPFQPPASLYLPSPSLTMHIPTSFLPPLLSSFVFALLLPPYPSHAARRCRWPASDQLPIAIPSLQVES